MLMLAVGVYGLLLELKSRFLLCYYTTACSSPQPGSENTFAGVGGKLLVSPLLALTWAFWGKTLCETVL